MRGNRVRSNGAGVLLGEEDTPPPSMFGTTMKYLSGFKARSLPIRAASAPLWSPLNQVGETMTLSRLEERVPQVLNPSSASGSAPPFWRAKFFAEKNSSSPMRLSCFGINSSKTHAIGCLFRAIAIGTRMPAISPRQFHSSHCHVDQCTCLWFKLACLCGGQTPKLAVWDVAAGYSLRGRKPS